LFPKSNQNLLSGALLNTELRSCGRLIYSQWLTLAS
jgi:hypothetical protein